ncbi:hypothetical protein [Herbiconiux flava]|uniref:Glycosidase n=1 Tax=Herbiconiux flava TaxID=881268 RepID=A0A852SH20_9MICO|nr:hypothetical protein [Herbiconiux flava]NYD68884.1 hypothetical protein [Herbiconiux flava]GLK15626.1 hypothetical protein GCM10017602_01080 [Herbiconiux flava]
MQLHKLNESGLVDELRALSASNDQQNIFNVSVRLNGSRYYAAYRARVNGEKAFRAYASSKAADGGGTWSVPLDLTNLAGRSGVAPVADPKLLILQGDMYVTFNTGYRSNADNDIYLFRLTPEPGPLQRCRVEGGRSRVEKNWAFFEAADEGLRAIYSLHPYTLLRAISGRLGTEDELVFTRDPIAPVAGDTLGAWSIGTQPLVLPDRMLLIAHEKLSIGPKRTYFGRLVEIRDDGAGVVSARVSRKRLVHSLRSMLPRRGAHNPNLLSATYFAGISQHGGDILLSYGVNDVAFGIATTSEESLWR